jgi:hypothetical protein
MDILSQVLKDLEVLALKFKSDQEQTAIDKLFDQLDGLIEIKYKLG